MINCVKNFYCSILSFSLFKTSKNPAVMIPDGSAMIATPTNADNIVNNLPAFDTGVISPS